MHPGVGGRLSSVLFFGRPYDELGYSTRGNHENTSQLTKGKKAIECCTEHLGIPRRGHKAIGFSIVGYDSKREHDPAKGSLVPENKLEETMLKLLDSLSKDVLDDAAALVRKSASDETDAGSNPLAETSPSVVTDAGRDPRAEARTESVTWKKTEPTIPNQGEITTCSRIFHKGPNGEVCRMTKTTRALRITDLGPHLQSHSENYVQRTTQS